MMLDLLMFTLGFGFGLLAFSQIAYPLGTLIPKVRVLLREYPQQRSLLLTILLLAPAVWTVILVSTVLFVHRYLPARHTAYLSGLAVVLLLVLFHLPKRSRDLERNFLHRLRMCARLSEGTNLSGRRPEGKD